MPLSTLKQIVLTPENIPKLKFEYYEGLRHLKEHTAQVMHHAFDQCTLHIQVWSNEQMEVAIRQFSIKLSRETNSLLHELFARRVFKEKYGTDYIYFLSVWLDPSWQRKRNSEGCEMTLKYSLYSKSGKEHRLKTKFYFTRHEALSFYAGVAYWDESNATD